MFLPYVLLQCNFQVLEKGPMFNQPAVLQILHCMTHYVDINSAPSSVLNSELFHTSTKYIQVMITTQGL